MIIRQIFTQILITQYWYYRLHHTVVVSYMTVNDWHSTPGQWQFIDSKQKEPLPTSKRFTKSPYSVSETTISNHKLLIYFS